MREKTPTLKKAKHTRQHEHSLYDFGMLGRHSLNALSATAFLLVFASFGIFVRLQALAASTQLVSPLGNNTYCMDDYRSGMGVTNTPNKVDIWKCNGTQAQEWSYNNNHTITNFGQCLDVNKSGVTNGTLVGLSPCNGSLSQQWTKTATNTIIGAGSGKCIDDPNASTVDGTQLQIWTCNGYPQQYWYSNPLPTPPPSPTPNPTPPPTPGPTPPHTPGPTPPPTPLPTSSPRGGGGGGGGGGSGGTGGSAGSGSSGQTGNSSNSDSSASPTTPTGFTATVGANAVVLLSWNPSNGVQSYTVERSVDQASWSQVNSGITSNTFSDSSTGFGIHYYYRLSAVDAADSTSGYAYADVTTPNFSDNTNSSNSSTFTSDDNVASAVVPSGAIADTADCSVDANTTQVNSKGKLRVVVGPYQLVCKDASGNAISAFLQPIDWTLNVKGRLKGLGKPLGYTTDQNNNLTAIPRSVFSSSDNLIKFSTTTANPVLAMAPVNASIPWNLIAVLLLTFGVIAGVGSIILRRSRRQGYQEYLRQKYYNL